MSEITVIAVALHALAAALWVGGMFFAHQVLRPTLGFLEPPQRLTLWNKVFARFFPWVWVAVIVLPVTGYLQIFLDYGGFDAAGRHVEIMHGLGWLMIALFLFLIAVPYRRFKTAVAGENWKEAAGQLAVIRRTVGTNLILGLLTIAIGASGRFWGWSVF